MIEKVEEAQIAESTDEKCSVVTLCVFGLVTILLITDIYCTACPYYHFTNYRHIHIVQYVLITILQITDILYSMFLLPVCTLQTYCIVCSYYHFTNYIVYSMFLLPFHKLQTYCTVCVYYHYFVCHTITVVSPYSVSCACVFSIMLAKL